MPDRGAAQSYRVDPRVEPAETFATTYRALTKLVFPRRWEENHVTFALLWSFFVVMRFELSQGTPER